MDAPQHAAAERYLVERVMTASPAELTAMLYDAAVGALRSAQRLQGEQQHLVALPRIQKAQDIVLELRSTLNHDDPAAGALAASLDALYTWCWTRLLEASTTRGSTGVSDALEVLAPLQEAWRASCCTLAAAAS